MFHKYAGAETVIGNNPQNNSCFFIIVWFAAMFVYSWNICVIFWKSLCTTKW